MTDVKQNVIIEQKTDVPKRTVYAYILQDGMAIERVVGEWKDGEYIIVDDNTPNLHSS